MRDPRACSRGQATIELLVVVPIALVLGALMLQMLIVGRAMAAADGAAEAGALAVASGQSAEAAVRSALPGWPRERVGISASGGRVSVKLRAGGFAGVGSIGVSSSAWALPPELR